MKRIAEGKCPKSSTLVDLEGTTAARHLMAEAVAYALSQWQELTAFCKDGAIPIDNSISEREMKRII